jgi:DNA alkylation repair enzyme
MANDRWAARAGWNLTASRVNKGALGLELPALLDRIEKEMPKAMPEVQWAMNNTLGAIGIHHTEHRKRAIAIGAKIGLYRDWPVSKGCIPPYVPVPIDAPHPSSPFGTTPFLRVGFVWCPADTGRRQRGRPREETKGAEERRRFRAHVRGS